MNKTRAQRIREMTAAGVGGLPVGSTRPDDPRYRRYTQARTMPYEQYHPYDFHVDAFGRLRLGAAPEGGGMARPQRRRRPCR